MSIHGFFSTDTLSKRVVTVGELPTTKSLYGTFFKMAWPAVIESVLLCLVNFVDSYMVSTLGINSVAAVGLTTQPRMIFYAVFFAMNISVTAIVSRRKGQGDRDGANTSLGQALGLNIVLALVLCGTAIAIAEPLLLFAGAKDDTIVESMQYFRITMLGMIFTSFGMVINAAQRGSGNTKISMRTNIVANCVNILFNYLLINGIWFFPELGVRGAAIATVIGNIASFAMSLYSLFVRDGYLRLKLSAVFRWKASLIATIGRIAFGAGIEQVFMRIGFFLYAKMVADLGTAEFATHTICMNIINLSFACGDGLSTATSALTGQNLGKKRPDIATIFGKAGQRIGLCVSLLLVLLFVFGGGMLVSMFADPADLNYEYVILNGANIMLIVAVVSPAQISQVIYNGVLRGAGDTKYVAVTSAISIAIVRPIATYILSYPLGLGLYGAWLSLLIDQYMRLALSFTRFKNGKWSKVII